MTTGTDSDKYYTPSAVACRALECAQLTAQPNICADTACGSGSLLKAAENVLRAKFCLGIDTDPNAIRQLRREHPAWRLYVGDLLKRHRAPPTHFPGALCGVDLLVLNPPFSLGHKKYVSIKYQGRDVKCSVAMAHVLRSLELFMPSQGAIAVVPESLLYSNTDQDARELLETDFSLCELLQLSIHTFKGARVNSSFVQIRTSNSRPKLAPHFLKLVDPIPAVVVRGGLQMHTFDRMAPGVPIIHSTSLKRIAVDGISSIKECTSSIAKGRISGWLLLLPRVGVPKEDAFRAFYSRNDVQLSDCVIALQFATKSGAFGAERRIRESWDSLLKLYRGTGARYITIDRLVAWLYSVGVHDRDAMKQIGELRLA